MARDLSPIAKQSRREGIAMHPKAMRVMMKRTNLPGKQPGRQSHMKASQYSLQLREKQKAKRFYGLLEKQFANLVKTASKSKGKTGEALMILLERRIDNTVYRAGFAPTRRSARQLVSHGQILLNGRRVDIPAITVNPGDKLTLREAAKKNAYFSNIEQIMASADVLQTSWLKVNRSNFTIEVTAMPRRDDAEQDVNEQLIVEYYSR